MKSKLFLFIFIFFLLVTRSFAAIHTIFVTDYSFTPSALSVHPGDTIVWKWQSGDQTITSKDKPTGARPWTGNISSEETSLTYIASVAGSYSYYSSSDPTQVTGSFSVMSEAGISQVNEPVIFKVYPVPISGIAHVQYNKAGSDVSLIIIDKAGKEVLKKTLQPMVEADINLKNIPNGNYIIRAEQDDSIDMQQLVVSH